MTNRPQNSKAWFTFHNSVDGETAIDIMDEIGCYGVSARAFRDQFSRLGKNERVKLHINSPGGDITDGMEIYNTLNEHEGNVSVNMGAMVASIATVIAMAGDEVTMAKNGRMVIHNPWVYAMGESDELRKMADIMDGMKADIMDAYKSRADISDDDLSEMMDEETWMTAEEALAMGFIDSIDGDEDTSARNFDLSRFKNAVNFSKTKNDTAPESASNAGNGKRIIKLRDLENAVKPQTNILRPKGHAQMTPEEKAALEAEKKKAIQDGVAAAIKAKNTRDNEIKAAVKLIRERDKKDFSDLAEDFISDDSKSLSEFHAALITSDKYKKTGGVSGAGLEVTAEPLDYLKGSPGFAVVTNDEFRAVFDRYQRAGRHQFGCQINIDAPRFRNATQTSSATSGSGLTSIQYMPGIVELGVRPITVEDLIAGGATDSTTVRYRQEVTYTQAAASVAETGTLANVSMTYTEVDAPVKDVGGYVEMSDNLMADYPAIASFINQRLPYQVDRAVDDQLMNGSGSGTDLTGILQTAGIQTAAVGAATADGGTYNRIDLALHLLTLVRWQAMTSGQAQGGFEPDGYVIHPTDWETLCRAKDANGNYYFRGPFVGAYGTQDQFGSPGSLVEYYTLWGKKVAVSPVTPQGTIVAGAWKMAAQKFDRQGLTIEMTNANGTNFVNRIVTVRGTRRLALAVYRPGCFATGTGY